ncbi:MAG: inositol monophosphatase family protein [Pseudomonadota bacterium]
MTVKDHGIEELTKFGVEVIRQSGDEALSFYGKGKSDRKFDDGLVTEAELHLAEFFQDQIQANFPDHQVFKNIQKKKAYTHEEERYLWVYDPLDGVANFQAGIPVWAISIALLENFWPVFGAVYMPATGDLFHAQAGGRAFLGEKEIDVSSQDNLNDESLLLTYSRFHQDYHSNFPGKIRDFGCTSAHLCYVAMGRAEAAIIANESFQGLAANRIIIEAAGGDIIKMDGNEFFLNEYLDGLKVRDHLLAGTREIFPQVRECLKQI